MNDAGRLEFEYVISDPQLARLVAQLMADPKLPIAVDTETNGLDPLARSAKIHLVQIGTAAGDVWVINVHKVGISPLKAVLEGGRLCILQNAKFDYKWLLAKAGIRISRLYDTMLAEKLLNAGRIEALSKRRVSASLKALTAKYCGADIDKSLRVDFVKETGPDFSPDLLAYAAEDIPHLFTIKEQQIVDLKAAGLIEVAKIEFGCVAAVAEMELVGMGIDAVKYAAVVAESRRQMGIVEQEIQGILLDHGCHTNLFGGVDINLNSSAHVIDYLGQFGHELKNADEAALKGVDHPFAAAVLRWREYETQVSSFGDSVLQCVHPVTGRIHAEFDQLGSDAGRFSCKKPNVQQIPQEEQFRSCFVADEGNCLVVGDFSQMELRIGCKLSGDSNMLEAFLTGRDLHTDTASRMYNVPYEEVEPKGKERKAAKIMNFALWYGMGADSVAVSLKCSKEEAKDVIARYFAAYPGAKVWLDAAGKSGLAAKECRTLAGRRRFLPDVGPEPSRGSAAWKEWLRRCGAVSRKAKNSPIQGLNSDILKLAMATLHRELLERGLYEYRNCGMVCTVHDEIVTEVPAEFGEEWREVQERGMVGAGQRYLGEVPVKAEVGIARCWMK